MQSELGVQVRIRILMTLYALFFQNKQSSYCYATHLVYSILPEIVGNWKALGMESRVFLKRPHIGG